MASGKPSDRITKVIASVNPGSFRVSAMIMGITETGELQILGSGHRASQGIKRGYVTDMSAATYAIRDAVERAEKNAGASVQGVWVGCAGAGLRSQISKVEIEIGGRRIEEEDIEQLLVSARQTIQPDGRMVLHAQPAHGVALVEVGGDLTNIAVYSGGMLVGLVAVPMGSNDITDAIASTFGIRRFQAERLKCVSGSAIASPSDHREMIPVNGPNDETGQGAVARGADEKNRIARAELVAVVTQQVATLTDEIGRALKGMGFSGATGGQVVLTGGGAELAGIAEFAQGALAMPVRLGRAPTLTLGPRYTTTTQYSGSQKVSQLFKALKEYF